MEGFSAVGDGGGVVFSCGGWEVDGVAEGGVAEDVSVFDAAFEEGFEVDGAVVVEGKAVECDVEGAEDGFDFSY